METRTIVIEKELYVISEDDYDVFLGKVERDREDDDWGVALDWIKENHKPYITINEIYHY